MRIGSMFTGSGMLDLAVARYFGGEVVFHVEKDKHASRLLSERFPDVSNFGDAAAVDWDSFHHVEVLTGGFPCQDLSVAGFRKGLRPGTRSGAWAYMAEAIERLRPDWVVIENVGGIRSAKAHRTVEVESCDECVGSWTDRSLRALGAVLGDLADLGFDAQWGSVRASDAGAPHRRERVFVFATAADSDIVDGDGRGDLGARGRDELADGRWSSGDVNLLPTPAVNDMGANKTVEWWDEWAPRQKASDGRSAPHGKRLSIELRRLLPTPTAQAARHEAAHDTSAAVPDSNLWNLPHQDFGVYEAAVERWASIVGPPPDPVVGGRLSPDFAEWMMGWPVGWTDVGLSRTQRLKIVGNGVVPQQALLALSILGGSQ